MTTSAVAIPRALLELPIEVLVKTFEFLSPQEQCRTRGTSRRIKGVVEDVAVNYLERIIDFWSPREVNATSFVPHPIGLILPSSVGEAMVFDGGQGESTRYFRCVAPPAPRHAQALLHRCLAGRQVAIWPHHREGFGIDVILRSWIPELQRRDRLNRSRIYGTTETAQGPVAPTAVLMEIPEANHTVVKWLREVVGGVMIVDSDFWTETANSPTAAAPIVHCLLSQLAGPLVALNSATVIPTSAAAAAADAGWSASTPLTVVTNGAALIAVAHAATEMPKSLIVICADRTPFQDVFAAMLRNTATPCHNVAFLGLAPFAEHRFSEYFARSVRWTGHVDLGYLGFRRLQFGAHSDCTSVRLPLELQEVGGDSFVGCPLRAIDLSGERLVSIGAYAFSECSALSKVAFSRTITHIGRDAFSQTALVRVDLSHCVGLRVIEANSFSHCPRLAIVVLPPALERLSDTCFSYLPSLTSVDFGPDGSALADVAVRVFEGCTALQRLALPSGVKTLGPICGGCTSLSVLDLSCCVKLTAVAPQLERNRHHATVILAPTATAAVRNAFRRHTVVVATGTAAEAAMETTTSSDAA